MFLQQKKVNKKKGSSLFLHVCKDQTITFMHLMHSGKKVDSVLQEQCFTARATSNLKHLHILLLWAPNKRKERLKNSKHVHCSHKKIFQQLSIVLSMTVGSLLCFLYASVLYYLLVRILPSALSALKKFNQKHNTGKTCFHKCSSVVCSAKI